MKKAAVDAVVGVASNYLAGYFRYVGGGLQTSVIADILTFVSVYSQLLTHEEAITGAAL